MPRWGISLLVYIPLDRISHQVSTAAADPGMSTALRSVGLLDVLSSTPAESSVALAKGRQMRLVSVPVAQCRIFFAKCAPEGRLGMRQLAAALAYNSIRKKVFQPIEIIFQPRRKQACALQGRGRIE